MKEDWVQGAPPHSHTQTSYAGTRAFMRHRARLPTTIVVACGLAVCHGFWQRFTAAGERVKGTVYRKMKVGMEVISIAM